MYSVTADILCKGKETIYRLTIFDGKKNVADMDAFEDYDGFDLAQRLIQEFLDYLNNKNSKPDSFIRKCLNKLSKHKEKQINIEIGE